MDNLLLYCPKCGSRKINIEPEPGQYTLICGRCNLYCEIMILDEGDSEELNEP
ncbi:MAG: hypothetical protein K6T80_00470 [Firmicutes bacterium]|nr:hypothetical protein [Bacillota bacterium]